MIPMKEELAGRRPVASVQEVQGNPIAEGAGAKQRE